MITNIRLNRIQCTYCGAIITSETVHDYKKCSCGVVAVDGGHEYLRREFTYGTRDYIELSDYD